MLQPPKDINPSMTFQLIAILKLTSPIDNVPTRSAFACVQTSPISFVAFNKGNRRRLHAGKAVYKARTKQRLVFFLASGHTCEDVLNMSMRRNFKKCFRAYHFMSLLIARPFLSPESVVSFDRVALGTRTIASCKRERIINVWLFWRC